MLAVHMEHVTAAQPIWMRVKLAVTGHFCHRLRVRVQALEAELATAQKEAAMRETELMREARAREEEICNWADELQGVCILGHRMLSSCFCIQACTCL